MTKVKEGRYTYFIIPEQNTIKCVSTYAKKNVVGKAVLSDGDTWNEEVGKFIARTKCDKKINEKRIKYLQSWLDEYFDAIQYYQKKHSRVAILMKKAEAEKRELTFEMKRVREM